MDELNFSDLSREQKEALLNTMLEFEDRVKYNKIKVMFPETGRYSRTEYKKHTDFFAAGSEFFERAAIGGNQSGKTTSGAFEVACHATGIYPDWWAGCRYDKPVTIWVCGKDFKQIIPGAQETLIGKYGEYGTGMIPRDALAGDPIKMPGAPLALQEVFVKHASGLGNSQITFKAYTQDLDTYMGARVHFIWFDEEPPKDIYTECQMRTLTTKGRIICTFTPLDGFTDVVMSYLNNGAFPNAEHMKQVGKYTTRIEWDDAPHLDTDDKKRLLAGMLPHEREARSKGYPSLGSGRIYPIAEENIVCVPFELSPHWPRAYGFDVGWNATAAVFGAYDKQTVIWYIYGEHLRKEGTPAENASAIRKCGGTWIPGIIDPSAAGAGKSKDGIALLDSYREEDLDLYLADNTVDMGIHAVYDRLTTGRLKFFNNCTNLLQEFRLYRRDAHGKVVKSNDHLLDALRYLMMTGRDIARTKPDEDADSEGPGTHSYEQHTRNSTTGY